jgi:sulfur-oxidizing protein SoxY
MIQPHVMPQRRRLLLAAGAAGAGFVTLLSPRPAAATPEAMREAMAAFAGKAPVRAGRIEIEIAELVENGNVVPIRIKVASPMSAADHVQRIALFTEANPDPQVAVFHLGPRSGRADVSTRMRLATSQHVHALALMSDGSVWSHSAEVIVTLAACIDS